MRGWLTKARPWWWFTTKWSFARQVASRIIFMDSGEVVRDRPPGGSFLAPRKPRQGAAVSLPAFPPSAG